MTESITTIAVRPPRRHRSAEEAAALVADWQASGQNKEAFCRHRGIVRSTLSSCLLRVTGGGRASAPAGFVERLPPSDPVGLSLDVGGGMRLIGLDLASAITLVTALRQVRR